MRPSEISTTLPRWTYCITAVLMIAGCAGQSGVVPIGQDTFMASKQGWISTQSDSALKADVFREASAYCASKGKQLMPVSTNSRPGVIGRSYPEVEVQFRCLNENDPELRRPTLEPVPNVRIESK